MIKYGDLVQYIKENHISWNRDLFDVLRGFFESYEKKYSPHPPSPPSQHSVQQELIFEHKEFKAPEDGEYSIEDTLNLFNT